MPRLRSGGVVTKTGADDSLGLENRALIEARDIWRHGPCTGVKPVNC